MINSQKGVGIVEVIVAAGLVGVVLAALLSLGNFALGMQNHFKKNFEAANLAAETLEAAKLLKSENWNQVGALSLDEPYHPVLSGTPLKFSLAAGEETIGNFSRKIIFSQVFRDGEDNIVAEGGALDDGTLKAISSVFWNEKGRLYQIELVYYLANWQ